MMEDQFKIGVLLGDDIGLEVVPEAVKVMRAAADATGLAVDWSDISIGRLALDQLGHTLPHGTLERLVALWKYVSSGVVIEGAIMKAT